MFVGGEFYNDSRWVLDKPTISTEKMTFLNGGKACLIVISAYLLDHGISKILLPTYLCPTIITTLEYCGLSCDYYQINPDFSIDLNDLTNKLAEHQAIVLINYFGFLHSLEVQTYLASLQKKGVLVVEDNAQAGFSDHTTGSFSFNSMRKFGPFDGGYLTTSLDLSPYINKIRECPNRRLPLIREYREKLANYLYQGTNSFEELDRLYNLAEYYYEIDSNIKGDPQEKMQIERVDWEDIKKVRRENYQYLLNLISRIPELSPIFPDLQDGITPLGLPVYVSGVSRDWLFDQLGSAGIGLTIHWDRLITDPRLNGNAIAVEMASKILTLVIDQRTSHNQMDYMFQILYDRIENAKMQGNSVSN
ncbi:MAG: hypothetical protein CVU46_00705 [Chloroflexi bacterium HGW-Chloroflexi-8]|nr:MAG: hypothetical protein CVU46_00705 [Chloroflexi bacterium HGW-Chloroflexi-8]